MLESQQIQFIHQIIIAIKGLRSINCYFINKDKDTDLQQMLEFNNSAQYRNLQKSTLARHYREYNFVSRPNKNNPSTIQFLSKLRHCTYCCARLLSVRSESKKRSFIHTVDLFFFQLESN